MVLGFVFVGFALAGSIAGAILVFLVLKNLTGNFLKW